jgi:hypothetical protein
LAAYSALFKNSSQLGFVDLTTSARTTAQIYGISSDTTGLQCYNTHNYDSSLNTTALRQLQTDTTTPP